MSFAGIVTATPEVMITQATLALLGYCIASAYVLVPAALLLLCGLLARFHVRIELPEPEQRLTAQRDVYAHCAIDSLVAFYAWRGIDDYRAEQAKAMAFWYRRRVEALDELLSAFI